MPARTLFDISHLNLDAVVMDRQAIAQHNPHRGHMALLDGVVWISEDYTRMVGVKHVRADEFWTAGHFPQKPIMPGVLLLEAAAQLANVSFSLRRSHPCLAGFIRIKDASFREQVVPGDRLILLAQESRFTPKRFTTDVQGLVDDRVVFDASIAGMVLEETPSPA